MKYIGAILFLILSGFFFQYRYLAPEAGVNAKSTDYSNHITIEQHLKEGIFFPELEKSEKGLHAVSRYLPVYHGLLGFHISAWVLEVLGMPLPGAYQLLMDLSLAICIFFFMNLFCREMKQEKRWEYLLAILAFAGIFLSNFSRAIESAAFSQVMSYALLVLSGCFWSIDKKKWSIFFLLFALVTYPDFLIWLIPVIVLTKTVRLPVLLRVVLSVVWVLLLLVLYSRRYLVGPEGLSLYPLFFLPLLLALFGGQLYREQKVYFYLLLSYTIITIGFLFASQRYFTWSYYALKLTYPAVFFLIYAFLKMRLLQNSRGRAFAALFIFFFWNFSDSDWNAVGGLFTRTKFLNNEYYAAMLETKKDVDELSASCKPFNTLVLPSSSDLYSEGGMLKLWAKNSLMLNADISTGAFKSSSFQKIYDNLVAFEKSYGGAEGNAEGNRHLFTALAKLVPFSQDICIVSPASERSLFNGNPCFVILKEQGGQIYAQCKANSEL